VSQKALFDNNDEAVASTDGSVALVLVVVIGARAAEAERRPGGERRDRLGTPVTEVSGGASRGGARRRAAGGGRLRWKTGDSRGGARAAVFRGTKGGVGFWRRRDPRSSRAFSPELFTGASILAIGSAGCEGSGGGGAAKREKRKRESCLPRTAKRMEVF